MSRSSQLLFPAQCGKVMCDPPGMKRCTIHLMYLDTCLKVMQNILEAGGAAEGHNNCILVPSKEDLTRKYRMESHLDPHVAQRVF